MSTLTETLAAHLPENHGEFEVGNWRCICGKEGWAEDDNDAEKTRQFASHVAKVIAETHAVIELPKPANVSEAEWTGEWVDGIITAHFGKGKVRCYLEDPRMTSDDAREIGAGLIAAAAAAETSGVSS